MLKYSELPGLLSGSEDQSPFSEQKWTALIDLLKGQYFPAFKRAGYHALYSLPEFNNFHGVITQVDYSSSSDYSFLVDSVHDVSVEDINGKLREHWLSAAALIDDQGCTHDDEELCIKHFLAEHKSFWMQSVEDLRMHVLCNPMRARALCNRELILILDIDEINFFLGQNE